MTDAELLEAVFGGEWHALSAACAAWIAASRPFRAFLDENASKIRKKVRQAGSGETLRDLWLEMSAAYHLLAADRRVTLVYERFLADKARGPDFTVTFKGHLVFNVEVRRLRTAAAARKLGDVLCEKLRQMPAGAVNVLLVGVDGGAASDLDCAATVRLLVKRAEAKEDAYFVARGLRDARDFLHALQRLGAVVVRAGWDDPATATAGLWLNPLTKPPL
ncbi:MAG TPA: hypothetical protein VGR57_13220, partial [Ktedonobacterales bacterium]|nr:hypothetical protein [Ktedonobacterales bacterium]